MVMLVAAAGKEKLADYLAISADEARNIMHSFLGRLYSLLAYIDAWWSPSFVIGHLSFEGIQKVEDLCLFYWFYRLTYAMHLRSSCIRRITNTLIMMLMVMVV